MWENAAPLPENESPRPPAGCAKSEEDLVLWAQILLCLAAIGLVLAAGALDWRNLLKFTEQTAGELADSARSMWEDFTLPATPESARTAHGQPSPPAYARPDSYTPGFPLQFPLPGQSRKTSGYGWPWRRLSHRQRPGCGTGHAGAGRRGRCGAHGGQP